MDFGENELSQIERLAIDIEKWQSYHPGDKTPDCSSAFVFRRSIISRVEGGIRPLLRKLRYHEKTTLVKRLESLRDELFNDIDRLPKNMNGDDDPMLMVDFGLSQRAMNLANELRAIVQNARAEKAGQSNGRQADSQNGKKSESWLWKPLNKMIVILKKIPNWIYILILFFAAFLTCLSYLGWLESFKVFFSKLFTHN